MELSYIYFGEDSGRPLEAADVMAGWSLGRLPSRDVEPTKNDRSVGVYLNVG